MAIQTFQLHQAGAQCDALCGLPLAGAAEFLLVTDSHVFRMTRRFALPPDDRQAMRRVIRIHDGARVLFAFSSHDCLLADVGCAELLLQADQRTGACDWPHALARNNLPIVCLCRQDRRQQEQRSREPHADAASRPKTRAKILSTLRSWRSTEKASAMRSGVSTARTSGSASMVARKSPSSSQARMAFDCTSA